MKKVVSYLLGLLMVCGVLTAQAETLRIGVMSGPTGMGMAALMGQENEAYAFDVYAAPTNATADLASGTLDLLCLPTNTAAMLANKQAGHYSVLAINCLSSLYVLSDGTKPIESVADLAGETVVAGVPSSTTGPILQQIFAKQGLDVELSWEADHDAVITRMMQGDVHVVVLPEPKATVALTKVEGWQMVLPVGEMWDAVFDTRLPMGCIVARSEVIQGNRAAIDQFLADYQASIQQIANPDNQAESAQLIADAGVLPSAGVAKKALSNLDGALVYEDEEAMKTDLTAFYALIEVPCPDDGFFYAK